MSNSRRTLQAVALLALLRMALTGAPLLDFRTGRLFAVGSVEANLTKEGDAWKVVLRRASPAGESTGTDTKVVEDPNLDALSWHWVAMALADHVPGGDDLRSVLTEVLRAAPFRAFFWECPPLTRAGWESETFEFVLLNAPHLAYADVDEESFSSYLGGHMGESVARAFPNLGGDSTLVAPSHAKDTPLSAYSHIASFFRGAPAEQAHELWRALGKAIIHRVSDVETSEHQPTWVSTEGSGVAYLHMRLDPRPKYYHWGPYMGHRRRTKVLDSEF